MSFSRISVVLAAALSASIASASGYQPGEVIVKYKDGAVRSRTEANSLYQAAGVKSVRRFDGVMKGMEQVILQDNVKVQDAIAEFMKSDAVEYAQPNYLLHAFPMYSTRFARSGGGIPCIPGIQIPGCDPNGGIPGVPGGGTPPPGGGGTPGGGIPCIPGIQIPGCDPNGGTPGGGGGGAPPWCNLLPGVALPGCPGGGGTPPPGGGGTPPPAGTRPDLQPAPADMNPAVADPDLAKSYGMSKIGATEVWKTWRGSKDFIVADIDTGIDYNHEDLAFNVWRNPNPGAQKDVVGFDFVHNDGLPFDDQGHGSHTAGTIGAVGGNGKGTSGVAQRVSLMAVKFLSSEGSGTTADAIRAIDYAITHGAKVLSNSCGGEGDDDNKGLRAAIQRAEDKGVIFVAAAGNGGDDGVGDDNDDTSATGHADYPASFNAPNEIAVAATDESDALAFFSNFGKNSVHVAAPGVNVYSTMPGNTYQQESGTSMACPHVAGAVALVWSKHPEWDYKKVKQVLMDSVDKIAGLEAKVASGGRINVLKALQAK